MQGYNHKSKSHLYSITVFECTRKSLSKFQEYKILLAFLPWILFLIATVAVMAQSKLASDWLKILHSMFILHKYGSRTNSTWSWMLKSNVFSYLLKLKYLCRCRIQERMIFENMKKSYDKRWNGTDFFCCDIYNSKTNAILE